MQYNNKYVSGASTEYTTKVIVSKVATKMHNKWIKQSCKTANKGQFTAMDLIATFLLHNANRFSGVEDRSRDPSGPIGGL